MKDNLKYLWQVFLDTMIGIIVAGVGLAVLLGVAYMMVTYLEVILHGFLFAALLYLCYHLGNAIRGLKRPR